jgi:NTP pyrophosphatase (non-canonical NTP hydrolase)
MTSLDDLFKLQKRYNDRIMDRDHNYDPEQWSETYLLGISSEIAEVLREINWKRNRPANVSPDRSNISYELADLTKFIISLWQIWGFTAEDMTNISAIKSKFLEQKIIQEYNTYYPDRVMIVDLDGSIADWRFSFNNWLRTVKKIYLKLDDPAHSLMMDSDLSMEYPDYHEWKNEFESSGQYAEIMMYPNTSAFLRHQKDNGQFIVYYTARPNNKYHRIWFDTMSWLEKRNLPVDELWFGSTERILLANKLQKEGHHVVMLEDDPELITRACKCGIRVYARRHKYNEGIDHVLVKYFDDYSDIGEYI